MKPERKARILVVDDEENIRKSLKMILEYEGYAVLRGRERGGRPGDAPRDARASTSSSSTSRCRGGAASRSWPSIRARPFVPEVVMISGQGTIQAAVEATKLGAFDFLEKPLHRERVLLSIRNALNQNKLRPRMPGPQEEGGETLRDRRRTRISSRTSGRRSSRRAPTNATVLIHGESGTGKELVARADPRPQPAGRGAVRPGQLRAPSRRSSSSPSSSATRRGAFTGATEQKMGKFEQADGGTIFLDEIGDMSLRTQSKVLRVLEEGEVQRVGSTKIGKVDVRVIAATQQGPPGGDRGRPLPRGPLFPPERRARSIPPALRERPEDIPLLVELLFAGRSPRRTISSVETFSPEAVAAMSPRYPGRETSASSGTSSSGSSS